MVVALRPHTLLQRREFRTFFDLINQSPAFRGTLVANPDDVEHILAFWEGLPQAIGKRARIPLVSTPSGVVVRTLKAQEWTPFLAQRMAAPQQVHHAGQSYLSAAGIDGQQWGAFTPDDRTLVLARDDLIRELIEDRNAPAPRRPWDEAWNNIVQGHLTVALETRWLRRQIAQGAGIGPTENSRAGNIDLTLISPLIDKARCFALGINASPELTVNLLVEAVSGEDAKPVANTMQALLTLGSNRVRGMQKDRPGQSSQDGDAMNWIVDAAGSLLDQARLETTGRFVQLRANSSLDLAAGVRLLASALSANSASRLNNLKMIGLGFHNYYSANNHYPTPVMYGGSNKSIPYSWRVAILPYIEQEPLYKQYNFDEPWDGPNNRKLLDKMPAFFGCPGANGEPASPTNASYYVFTGKGTALSPIPSASSGAIGGFMRAEKHDKPSGTGH